MTTNPLDNKRVIKIKESIKDIKNRIEQAAILAKRKVSDINLMAVTKTVPPEYVNIAINEGINLLGENKAQELNSKYNNYNLDDSIKIHFIGHLQRNKVKSIIDKVSMIESVDSESLAREIGKQAIKADKVMPILLEVNIGLQETKTGFNPKKVKDAAKTIAQVPGVQIKGLMTIPPKDNIKYYFEKMREIYIDISQKKIDNVDMSFLSMGMSGDFETAIAFGANIVRIGSLIFGKRVF